jgi:hypothetical protein
MHQNSMSRKRPTAHPATLVRRLRGFLARRLRVVRKGVVIHIVFAPTLQDATDPSPKPATGPVADELRQVGSQLRQRLNRHAFSRTVFVQLAMVERGLGRHGYAALQSLPLELLYTALEQLAVVIGPVPGELATLRIKLLDATMARAPKAGDFFGNLALSVFDVPHKLEVIEASASSFFHAEEDWARLAARPAPTVVLPTLIDTPEGRARRR